MGVPKSKAVDVQVPGVLAPYADAFHASLIERGYTPLSAVVQMRLVAHLSRWLDESGLRVDELTDERAAEFMVARQSARASWRQPDTRPGPGRLIEFLRSTGVLSEPVSLPVDVSTAEDELLASFGVHLVGERGLRNETVYQYVNESRRFVRVVTMSGKTLGEITTSDVARSIVDESKGRSCSGMQRYATAIRSFLRFCFRSGTLDSDLSGAAVMMAARQRSMLPRSLNEKESRKLLASCDRSTAFGRRDYAVLLLLLRLGLRAGELAGLTLDDCDWQAGEIVVRGKGNREERLPLPADVGESIAAYLRRDRPPSKRREVFLRIIAPSSCIGRGAVTTIVYRACERAGIDPASAHRLRHTMAHDMVRAGVPLPEISQVLRHNQLATTAIYTRVDLDMLRSLALPWPEQARA